MVNTNSAFNLSFGVALGGTIGYLIYPKIESNNIRSNFIKNRNLLRNGRFYNHLFHALDKYCFNRNLKVIGGFYPSTILPSNENLVLRESYLSSVSFRNKIPNWVAEKINEKTCNGKADRSNCIFQSDIDVPLTWSAENKDYFASGYSRGHMAAAGQHKDTASAQSDTFFLSGNIVPQEISNNGGDWCRLEILSRELTKYYDDVYVVSGPLFMPSYMRSKDFREIAENVNDFKREDPPKDALGQICVIHKKDVVEKARELGDEKYINPKLIVKSDLKDTEVRNVSHDIIGNKLVSAPTHLFKIILGAKPKNMDNKLPPVVLSSFIMRNAPEKQRHNLEEYVVPLKSIEIASGLDFSGMINFAKQEVKKRLGKKEYNKLNNKDSFENNCSYQLFSIKNTLKSKDNPTTICCDTDTNQVTAWRYLGYLKLVKNKDELEKVWQTIKDKGYDKENIFLRKEYVNVCKSLGFEPKQF